MFGIFEEVMNKMVREEAIRLLKKYPYKVGHVLGFSKLTEIHNEWIIKMIRLKVDYTLQAHRG